MENNEWGDPELVQFENELRDVLAQPTPELRRERMLALGFRPDLTDDEFRVFAAEFFAAKKEMELQLDAHDEQIFHALADVGDGQRDFGQARREQSAQRHPGPRRQRRSAGG
jgi:hypothetical protein